MNKVNWDEILENIFLKENLESLRELIDTSGDFIMDVFIQSENNEIFWLKNEDPLFFKSIFLASTDEFLNDLRFKESNKVDKYETVIHDKSFLYLKDVKENVRDIGNIVEIIREGKYIKNYSNKDLEAIKKFKLIVKLCSEEFNDFLLGIQYLTASKIFKDKRILALTARKIQPFKEQFFIVPKNTFDYIVVGDTVLIRNLTYFERDFGFYKKYEEAKDEVIEEIKRKGNLFGKDVKLKGIDDFSRKIKNKPLYLKRFYKVIKKGNYKKFEFSKVKGVIKDFNLKVKFDEDNKCINLSEETSIKDFLQLYDELYYRSDLSGNRMVASENSPYQE
ncbi:MULTISPECIES: Kiwa anti-phage protein KwaB-like domain-containing protein [Petrotoga]|uniref:Uncharacterized protein DUF4868 n=2 Tax=Petrotoga sibirica TaxID=156202 RepID=A0A4R8EZI0_9BACT|nr:MULTISPECIES: Kiwa anti-phage protein KwaB-like domain-containing protein [Petrotoga]POZ89469.1 hypothetical protein AA80_00530 [Petrotoga sibirica DSM 13575]POZ91911.1 hypothetical protein AD60_00530 [Petrotoga sp. SL27]TDX16278.1 uncharacterized protein DUF4868 [Petrotoga sibirica]